MKRFPLFFCIPAKEKEWRKSPLFTLLEYAADYRRDLCLTDSLLYGHGRRLDVKADCLCKLCKGVMDGQRIRNLIGIAVFGRSIRVNDDGVAADLYHSRIVAAERYEQIDRNLKT